MEQQKGSLPYLVDKLKLSTSKDDIYDSHIWYVVRNAIDPTLLISNIAEALRISVAETEEILIENGFGDLVAQRKISKIGKSLPLESVVDFQITPAIETFSVFKDLFKIEFSPPIHQPIKLPSSLHDALSLVIENIVQSATDDAFIALYRKNILEYYEKFVSSDAKLIDQYIAEQFHGSRPRYIINSGIGANEQFNHFVASLNNSSTDSKSIWLIIDSPRHLLKLPLDATVGNTLFMEFSRSGKTEETLKIHEYTPRNAKRIIFANSGPLREIGNRDNNLVLKLPDQVSGRFGRNTTPILLAVMHVIGMDTKSFWYEIENAIKKFDLSSRENLPLQIAQFIYIFQKLNGINHIYLGCNDDILAASADELLQFWNEGVNKNGNDISMSRYFGLLRDSHLNIEGILANSKTKMGIFLLRDNMCPDVVPHMVNRVIDPINQDHAGMIFGEEEKILAEANYQRFSELMPTIKISILGNTNLKHAAILGQLWSDVTFCYSRMVNVDPGSNPEVKFVRDRAARLLAEVAKKRLRG